MRLETVGLDGLTGLPAGFTVSAVTRILAAVEAAVELVAADQGALVLHDLVGHRQKQVTTPLFRRLHEAEI